MATSKGLNEREERLASERKRIGVMLKQARKTTYVGNMRVTQELLAFFIGTSKDRISRVENGHTSLRADELVLACEKVGVTVVFAVDFDKTKSNQP